MPWIESLDNRGIMLDEVGNANASIQDKPNTKNWSKTISNFVCSKSLNREEQNQYGN